MTICQLFEGNGGQKRKRSQLHSKTTFKKQNWDDKDENDDNEDDFEESVEWSIEIKEVKTIILMFQRAT